MGCELGYGVYKAAVNIMMVVTCRKWMDKIELIRFVRDKTGGIERVAYHMRQFPKD